MLLPDKYCLYCGKKLNLKVGRDIERKKYCSRYCLSKHRWQIGIFKGYPITDEAKEKMRQSKLRLLSQGWKTVGWRKYDIPVRISGRGYKFKGSKREHKILMEKLLNRKLLPNEIVHHKDGNKLNNNIDNLIVMTRSEHIKLHNKLRREAICHQRHSIVA